MERTRRENSQSDSDVASDVPLCDLSLGGLSLTDSDDDMTGNDDKQQPTEIVETPVLSSRAHAFWEACQETPLQRVVQNWLSARRSQSQEDAGNGSYQQNPSTLAAFQATNQLRLDFKALLQVEGSSKHNDLWSSLSLEDGDAVLSRLFLESR